MKHLDRHELCPVPRCLNHLDRDGAEMCRSCWVSLPSYMRSEVRRAEGTPAYADVIEKARQSAADGLSDQAQLGEEA